MANVAQDRGFTGREFDAETGLYYYRARHYDPALGRFLQSDPLGFAAGDLNLYAYSWNDPQNWTDPNGLAATADGATLSNKTSRTSATAVPQVRSGVQCLSRKIGTAIASMGDDVIAGDDLSRGKFHSRPGCRVEFEAPPCGCKGGGGSVASFATGTELLTPEGRVAIETLREGDLVIARDEETGQTGAFPVTALMSRTSPGVIWLTLEDSVGKTTQLGVTSEHPLFVVRQGWVTAGKVAAGDVLRNAELHELAVLAVEVDAAPAKVHNLEVAGAQTYFAGELKAWGHNASKKAKEVICGLVSPDDALNFMINALGPNPSNEGNGRYKPSDGRNQVRFGDHETRNPRNLHCHIEDVRGGKVTFTRTFRIKS